jgi:hypothetical protein
MLAAAMARTKTMVLQQQLLLVVEGNLAPIVAVVSASRLRPDVIENDAVTAPMHALNIR